MESFKIYKYYSPKDYNFENLEKNQFFFQYTNKLNDPFDCLTNIDFRVNTYNDLKELVLRSQVMSVQEFNLLSNKQKRELINEFKFHKRFIFDYRQKSKKDLVLICCFTKEKNNPLLWSHYTDSYQGYMLEFSINKYTSVENKLCFFTNLEEEVYYLSSENIYKDINGKIINPKDIMPIYEVKYSKDNKLPKPALNPLNIDYLASFKFMISKNNCWSYENEMRMIINKDFFKNKTTKSQACKFKKSILKRVYLGLRITKEHKDKIISILIENYNRKPELLEAYYSPGKYQVIFKPIKY